MLLVSSTTVIFNVPYRHCTNDILIALSKAFVRGATSEDHSTYIISTLPIKDSVA